jgi:biopolymer transport protein ExbD
MAEIISRNRKGKKVAPRIDLTPMVDLGFLLITFFIVSTSMTKPVAMPINIPAKGNDTKAANCKTLNIIISSENKVYYYNGVDSTHFGVCSFSNDHSLRDVIISKQSAVAKQFGNRKETLVLIKPTSASNYKNVVDALDEMLINDVTRYMVINASKFEEGFSK